MSATNPVSVASATAYGAQTLHRPGTEPHQPRRCDPGDELGQARQGHPAQIQRQGIDQQSSDEGAHRRQPQTRPGPPLTTPSDEQDHRGEERIEKRFARQGPAHGVPGLGPAGHPRADESRVGDHRTPASGLCTRTQRRSDREPEEQGHDGRRQVQRHDASDTAPPERTRPLTGPVRPQQHEPGKDEEEAHTHVPGAADGEQGSLRTAGQVGRQPGVMEEHGERSQPTGTGQRRQRCC